MLRKFFNKSRGADSATDEKDKSGQDQKPVLANEPPQLDPDDLLLEAAHEGDLEAVKTALQQGASVNCRTPDGWTPVLAAVEHSSVVRYLVEQGADLNLGSDRGYSPLMRAGGKGQVEVVRLLLNAGADPTARDFEGKSAFRLSSESMEFETAELICEAHAQALVAEGDCPDGYELVPLDDASIAMIGMTRQSVGGTVLRVDLKFGDETSLQKAKVIDEIVMELPTEYARKHISSVSVPFEQF